MTLEYDFETLPLTEDQKQMIAMNIGNVEHLNIMIREVINKRAADGWEPLYPFAVPHVWFKRAVIKKRATRRKKVSKKS